MKTTKYVRGLILLTALLLCLLAVISCTKLGDDADSDSDTTESAVETIADDNTDGATEEGAEAEPDATQQPTEDSQGEASADTQASPEATQAATEAATKGSAGAVTEAATEAATQKPVKVVVATKDNLNFDKNITINQSGGSATVTANQGLTYTATGYSGVSGNRFTINKGFAITLDPAKTSAQFNRFTICYVSTQPLKATITYTEGGQSRTDSFFLEAGENTFSCVNVNYLAGKKGTGISRMTFESCNNQNATFALCLLKTQDYPVYSSGSDNTYYIENSRYKLGVRLSWGGGINYLSDAKAARGLRDRNLINQADTGRLVQQSYYGTSKEGSYQAGVYNDAQWKYNPVQGGDAYQNHSRIIDIVVNEYSVYVKSQPQDWSLDNQITPSYMENSYTLYADYIKVDNRFVDFSGMTTHPYTHQELPAFYTLSVFKRFYWYDGSSGWTGDTLSYRDDLNFWGDPLYHNDCTIPVRQSNTETWCAWVHPSLEYGIGLYVPNVDVFLAGKYAYNGSSDSKNGATNYVAPLNNMKMVSYQPLEYSYLMTTGQIEEIREIFKANRNFATNAGLHNNYKSMRVQDIANGQGNATHLGGGSSSGNTSGGNTSGGNTSGGNTTTASNAVLTFNSAASIANLNPVHNSAVAFDSSKGAAKLTATGDDTQVAISYGGKYAASSMTTLTIEYMIPTTNSRGNYNTDLFICAGSYAEAAEGCRVRQALVRDGQWHTLTVNLSGQSFWSGNLNMLRFDFFDVAGAGDVMYVKSISFK